MFLKTFLVVIVGILSMSSRVSLARPMMECSPDMQAILDQVENILRVETTRLFTEDGGRGEILDIYYAKTLKADLELCLKKPKDKEEYCKQQKQNFLEFSKAANAKYEARLFPLREYLRILAESAEVNEFCAKR